MQGVSKRENNLKTNKPGHGYFYQWEHRRSNR